MSKNLTPAMLERVAVQFRALAEPSRLRLMSLIFAGEQTVGELALATGFTFANVSKQLAILHRAGWLLRRKDGLSVRYQLADARAVDLCELMCARVRERAEAELAAATSPPRRRSRG